MTNGDYPWEPPLAGTEVEHLLGALDRLRTTFRWKADLIEEYGRHAGQAGSTSESTGPTGGSGHVLELGKPRDQVLGEPVRAGQ